MPAMTLQAAVVEAGGFMIVNVADVKIDHELIPLEKWTVECGKAAGLIYKGQAHPYELNSRFGLQGNEAASEPVPARWGSDLGLCIRQNRQRPWLVLYELTITCRENKRREILRVDQKEDAKVKLRARELKELLIL